MKNLKCSVVREEKQSVEATVVAEHSAVQEEEDMFSHFSYI